MHAVDKKPENYRKEISGDFPFKGREAVKQKGLHGGWDGRFTKVYNVHIEVAEKAGKLLERNLAGLSL